MPWSTLGFAYDVPDMRMLDSLFRDEGIETMGAEGNRTAGYEVTVDDSEKGIAEEFLRSLDLIQTKRLLFFFGEYSHSEYEEWRKECARIRPDADYWLSEG